jgi:hypothetical protein
MSEVQLSPFDKLRAGSAGLICLDLRPKGAHHPTNSSAGGGRLDDVRPRRRKSNEPIISQIGLPVALTRLRSLKVLEFPATVWP